MTDRLSGLQRALVEAFFGRTREYFLSGGAALAGYHLGHRRTDDLDLFAVPEVDLEAGARALRGAAAELGADVEVLQESPDFRRFAVRRGSELTVVDLVVDRAPQISPDKPDVGAVRVDPLREIAANKICALLGRTAPRDLVDVRALIEHGLSLDEMVRDARRKDGGVDPASLAWVLSTYRIRPGIALPEGVDADELDGFREQLVDELARMALPDEEP